MRGVLTTVTGNVCCAATMIFINGFVANTRLQFNKQCVRVRVVDASTSEERVSFISHIQMTYVFLRQRKHKRHRMVSFTSSASQKPFAPDEVQEE